MNSRYVQHPAGIWRGRANAVGAVTQVVDGVQVEEQVWLLQEQIGPNERAVLCCLPFFVYGLALGDVVQLQGWRVKQLITSSGRQALRVHINDNDPATSSIVADSLMGSFAEDMEWMTGDVGAFDIRPGVDTLELGRVISRLVLEHSITANFAGEQAFRPFE